MADTANRFLDSQFDIAWKLADYHLAGLSTDECLWRPATRGLHVRQKAEGLWIADWPESEGYDIGPPSIAWLTWHIGFWWSMVLDHSFGKATLSREDVIWPGGADEVRDWLDGLHRQWRARLDKCNHDDLRSETRTRWPMTDRPFGEVVAWVNIELMKNVAEIGYARFLYAVARK